MLRSLLPAWIEVLSLQPPREAVQNLSVTAAFRRVAVRYGSRQVLDGVDVELRPGVTFLVGQNGVGKTSLLRVLLGSLQPFAGHAEVGGVAMSRSNRSDLVARIGFLPQSFTAPGHMRVLDFLRYFGWLRGVPRAELGSAAHDALALVGLTERAYDRIGALSGGMLRRVGVAQALVHHPEVVLLDEPTVGLDPTARVAFRQLVERLAVERTVMSSTHLLEDVAITGGTIVALHEGRVAFQGPTSALVERSLAPTPAGMSPLEHAFVCLVSDEPNSRGAQRAES